MQEKGYRTYLSEQNLDETTIESSIKAVVDFEEYLKKNGINFESLTIKDTREYVSLLISQKRNDLDRLLALARYNYMIGKKNVYIYFTSILGGRNILPSISERLASIAGHDTRNKIFDEIKMPPLGSPPEEFPKVTKLLMDKFEAELNPETYCKVLAGNHHKIPLDKFNKHKKWFQEAKSLDEYLKKVHDEAVTELEHYLVEGKVWYEQEITPEVVKFVKNNQEILSGSRIGDQIYMTKIPYAPKDYLEETDPLMKRYYTCHCPLVRESILTGNPKIPRNWCYCSGGYGKLRYDVVFEESVDVELLESVLDGDLRCRFAIKIPEGKMK
jgi:hypothetical protein